MRVIRIFISSTLGVWIPSILEEMMSNIYVYQMELIISTILILFLTKILYSMCLIGTQHLIKEEEQDELNEI
jgi:hypothetical protein